MLSVNSEPISLKFYAGHFQVMSYSNGKKIAKSKVIPFDNKIPELV